MEVPTATPPHTFGFDASIKDIEGNDPSTYSINWNVQSDINRDIQERSKKIDRVTVWDALSMTDEQFKSAMGAGAVDDKFITERARRFYEGQLNSRIDAYLSYEKTLGRDTVYFPLGNALAKAQWGRTLREQDIMGGNKEFVTVDKLIDTIAEEMKGIPNIRERLEKIYIEVNDRMGFQVNYESFRDIIGEAFKGDGGIYYMFDVNKHTNTPYFIKSYRDT